MNRVNNFDLIRLLAALQVVIWHSLEHLKIQNVQGVNHLVGYFPGVSVFFTVSGFLVYASFESNVHNPLKYFSNRMLRIFPGLWFSFFVTVVLLFSFGIVRFHDMQEPTMITWIIGQLTIGQFYTPDLLRTWGVGTPNGSLWTIPVEIQFYLLVPLIFWLLKRSRSGAGLMLLLLGIISYLSNVYISSFEKESMVRKVGSVLVFPYLYQFLFGIFLYKYWNTLKTIIEARIMLWICVYGVYVLVFSHLLGFYYPSYWPNLFGLIGNLLLGVLTLSAAFSYPGISGSILRESDISYGVYIYHMLVVNTLLTMGLSGHVSVLLFCIIATCLMAFLSWRLVEKPSLLLKEGFAKALSR